MKAKLYKFYGVLLSDILKHVNGVTKKELHSTLKRAKDIDSLTALTRNELHAFIQEIIAHFASEYGIELLEDNKSLKELFEDG